MSTVPPTIRARPAKSFAAAIPGAFDPALMHGDSGSSRTPANPASSGSPSTLPAPGFGVVQLAVNAPPR